MPAENADQHQSSAITISIKNKTYEIIQSPWAIIAESIEDNKKASKAEDSQEKCLSNLLNLSEAVRLYQIENPDEDLSHLDWHDYDSFSGFLVKQNYLMVPIASDCRYRVDYLGGGVRVFCLKHGFPVNVKKGSLLNKKVKTIGDLNADVMVKFSAYNVKSSFDELKK